MRHGFSFKVETGGLEKWLPPGGRCWAGEAIRSLPLMKFVPQAHHTYYLFTITSYFPNIDPSDLGKSEEGIGKK